MARAAVGQVAFDNAGIAPFLVRVGDVIRTELTKHRTPPGEFLVGVGIIRDEPALPGVEILELRIELSGQVGFLVVKEAGDLAVGAKRVS